LKRAVRAVLVLTLLVSAYVAWSGFTDRELVWPISAVIGGEKDVTGTDPDFHDLDVGRDDNSLFDGTVTVENPTGDFQEVFVTVDVFDGDQNVGDLTGSVTLKPRSASSVDLLSLDSYVTWTDAHVDLLRLPN
jgi:hypothetical protein